MCKLIRLIYISIPFQGFRYYLIKKHLADCPRCRRKWELDQVTEKSFTMPEWIKKESSLWPQIQVKINRIEREEALSERRKITFHFPRRQWALASVVFFIFVGLIFIANKDRKQPPPTKEISLAMTNPQVKIIHAKIQGKKAKTFIYQTKENLFIWFDEINQEED